MSSLSRLHLVGLVAVSCLPLGCGGLDYEAVDITGTVTIDGKSVPTGQVLFTPAAQGKPAASKIVDGKYECKNVPVGACRVTFVAQAKEMKTIPVPATGGEEKVPINILPVQYAAGIDKTVKSDDVTIDFKLNTE